MRACSRRPASREHREIAARMYRNYPEVFQPKGKRRKMQVFSRSTSVGRVIQSMRSFDGALKMCEPELDIREESGGAYNGYLNHYTKAYKDYYKDGAWRAVYDASAARGFLRTVSWSRFSAMRIT